MAKIGSFCFAIVACLAISPVATAEPVLWLDVGAKGAVGGNYLSEPTDGKDSIQGLTLPYEEGAGGIGGGGGLFFDVRVLNQYLGLEVDLLFEGNKNWCSITYNDTVDVDYIYKSTAMRIPILLKGNLTSGMTRVSLGFGPEFVVGLDSETDIEVTEGDVADILLESAKNAFKARTRSDVFLTWDLGLAISVWNLAITLDLRFSYNTTLPKDYEDRVEFSGSQLELDLTTEAAHTLDGRLMAGLAYRFEI
ncbi:MAG: outer membrane beta-barrel protein [Myxococcota bacterium]|nr:outer membrane beta-barrel protein [Myxococcota bacterium]